MSNLTRRHRSNEPAQSASEPAGEITESQLALVDDLFIRPTPDGVLHLITATEPDELCLLIRSLLAEDATPPLTLPILQICTGVEDPQQAMALLLEAQDRGFVEGLDAAQQRTDVVQPGADGIIGAHQKRQAIVSLLAKLSDRGEALLSDPEGRVLYAAGFHEDHHDAVAAAGVAGLELLSRIRATLNYDGVGRPLGCAAVDHFGASHFGCWAISLDDTPVVLTIGGLPRLHNPALVSLVWLLLA